MKKLILAALLAMTAPINAAELWIDESGDFYVERTPVDLAMFSEMEDVFPRTYCTSPKWTEKGRPGEMKCDNGTTYKVEVRDAETLLVDGTPFYKVD